MLIVRPARLDDFEAILQLADMAGPGFTSLAVGADILKARIKKSVNSFKQPSRISPEHIYLLVEEDTETGELCGLGAIKAQIGVKDPFFNFRILKQAQKSKVTNRRFDMDVLVLVNDYAGATEVGSLFVKPEKRGTTAGRLMAQSRYMLMAGAPNRFADKIISDLRGKVDETGRSEFWEAIGRKFFQMNYYDADNTSGEKDNQFILDLMPKYPIYVALLPEAAQETIGEVHPAGQGARKFLEAEGFRYDGLIDIFDGGPSLSVPQKEIRTIKQSRKMNTAKKNETTAESNRVHTAFALISNDKFDDFRCVYESVILVENTVCLSDEVISALSISQGETVRLWIKR